MDRSTRSSKHKLLTYVPEITKLERDNQREVKRSLFSDMVKPEELKIPGEDDDFELPEDFMNEIDKYTNYQKEQNTMKARRVYIQQLKDLKAGKVPRQIDSLFAETIYDNPTFENNGGRNKRNPRNNRDRDEDEDGDGEMSREETEMEMDVEPEGEDDD